MMRLCLALLALLTACSTTQRTSRTVDLTDERTALRTEYPDTVYVHEPARTVIMTAPGWSLTQPETVRVYEPLPDTVDTFPLQSLQVDSSSIRVRGREQGYTVAAPCFGETLHGESVNHDLRFWVEGDCTPRDTVVTVVTTKESMGEKLADRAGRLFLIGMVLLIAGGILREVIGRVLPF